MLKRINRIGKQKDFDQFFGQSFKKHRGRNASSRFAILKTYLNGRDYPRVTFIISNKIDKRATARNAMKRQFREIVRKNLPDIKENCDMLFIAKPAAKTASVQALRDDLLGLMKKAGII